MERLFTPAEVAEATDDPLCRWTAQQLVHPEADGNAAWRHGTAVAVLGRRLNRGDRLAITGTVPDATSLVRDVLADVPDSVKLLGTTELIDQVVARIGGLTEYATFGWMDLTFPEKLCTVDVSAVDWLSDAALEAVDSLLDKANPHSRVRPKDRTPQRWAGMSTVEGVLTSVGASSWPAPDVGLIAGVATAPEWRRRGESRSVCAFLASELLAKHGAVALMVDQDNLAAVRLYQRLGFTYRDITAFVRSAD